MADLAAKIMVGTGNSALTNNWQSFRHFHEAIKLRFGDQSSSIEDDAISSRSHLEHALAYDPFNWIARFNLALALCKDNQPRTALEHFKILEDVFTAVWRHSSAQDQMLGTGEGISFCREDHVAFKSVLRHVVDHPECPFLVLYNRAIALASLRRSEERKGAIQILDEIGSLMNGENTSPLQYPYNEIVRKLNHRSRTELALYDDTEGIRALTGQINNLCLREQEYHWRSLQAARAVSLTALARVHMRR